MFMDIEGKSNSIDQTFFIMKVDQVNHCSFFSQNFGCWDVAASANRFVQGQVIGDPYMVSEAPPTPILLKVMDQVDHSCHFCGIMSAKYLHVLNNKASTRCRKAYIL